MLLEDYERVSQAPTREALRDALVSFAERMDFSWMTSALVTDNAIGSSFTDVSNVPEASSAVFESIENAHRDPVMQHLKTRNTPLIWDQRTYVDAHAADMWEVQAPFGFCSGIALALHLPNGRHFLLGMDRDKALPKRDAKLTRMVADLHLLAVHAQDAALRLLAPAVDMKDPAVPYLTPRELEILRWLVQGKSNKGVANILQVTDNTIEFHLKNVFRKLDCKNRNTAIIKAMHFGLL